jgi:hypothetical protein
LRSWWWNRKRNKELEIKRDLKRRLAGRLALPITGHEVVSRGRAKLLLSRVNKSHIVGRAASPSQPFSRDRQVGPHLRGGRSLQIIKRLKNL